MSHVRVIILSVPAIRCRLLKELLLLSKFLSSSGGRTAGSMAGSNSSLAGSDLDVSNRSRRLSGPGAALKNWNCCCCCCCCWFHNINEPVVDIAAAHSCRFNTQLASHLFEGESQCQRLLHSQEGKKIPRIIRFVSIYIITYSVYIDFPAVPIPRCVELPIPLDIRSSLRSQLTKTCRACHHPARRAIRGKRLRCFTVRRVVPPRPAPPHPAPPGLPPPTPDPRKAEP